MNVLKTPSSDTSTKKMPSNESVNNAPPIQSAPITNSTKNVRGIIHLPSTPVTETVDQANQTYSGDFCATKEEGYDSEEERRVNLLLDVLEIKYKIKVGLILLSATNKFLFE